MGRGRPFVYERTMMLLNFRRTVNKSLDVLDRNPSGAFKTLPIFGDNVYRTLLSVLDEIFKN